MKNNVLYIAFAAIFLVFLAWGVFHKSPTDWSFSYSKYDKKPFGAYILHQSVKELFPNKPFLEKHKEEVTINEARETTSDSVMKADAQAYIEAEETVGSVEEPSGAQAEGGTNENVIEAKKVIEKTDNPQNFIYFNHSFAMDNPLNVENLMGKVEEGNYVFIAAENFSYHLEEKLGFKSMGGNTDLLHHEIYTQNLREPEIKTVNFVNDKLAQKEGFALNELATTHYLNFTYLEHKPITLAVNEQKQPILVKIPYGHGAFILSSTPLAFTNYFLLTKDGEAFANNALSYLPIQETVWDEYYKFDNLKDISEGRNRTLRYIQSQPPLNWAMWLMIISSLIYMLVEMKRRQRIIEEIKPLQNSTLEFTETIGQLYFRSQDHKNVAEKISRTFLDHIRNRYYLRTQEFDNEFFDSLAAKSGITKDYLVALFDQIKRIRRSEQILEDDLISFSAKVEKFYEVAK